MKEFLRNVATLPARPETPDEIGRPVQLVSVPEAGVPRTGVTRVGDVANTRLPDPVSSVMAVLRFADEGVSRNSVTPVPALVNFLTETESAVTPVKLEPSPENDDAVITPTALTPPWTSSPVTSMVDAAPTAILVPVAAPRTGVTRVGVLANTRLPVPVSSSIAPLRLAELGVPKKVLASASRSLRPVIGRPVQFVSVPEAGVPRAGDTKVGEVANTRAPEPVSPVTAAARLAELGVPKNVATLPPRPVRFDRATLPSNDAPVTTPTALTPPATLSPVTSIVDPVPTTMLVAVAAPRTGVTRVGEVANTRAPDPVSSVTAEARLAELGVPRNVATLPARPETPEEIGRPVQFVRVPGGRSAKCRGNQCW